MEEESGRWSPVIVWVDEEEEEVSGRRRRRRMRRVPEGENLEEETRSRNPQGGILEKKRRTLRGTMLDKGTWRRNHEGGCLREESWKKVQKPGRAILEEEPYKRNPGGGIM